MPRPDFDPSWLLDMAKDSTDLFKQTLGVMLDAHREEAASFEQERIIKLLKEQCCDCDSDNCKGWFLPDAESLIALIKGEQA